MEQVRSVEELPFQNTISRRPVGIGMSRLVPPGTPSYPPSTHPPSDHRTSPEQINVTQSHGGHSTTLLGTPKPSGPYGQPYSLEDGGNAAIQPGNQLKADLSERHVNMMAFSQCVGIGLFLQAGRVIYLAGPGLGAIAYIITGTVLWSCAACLGEMTALFPVKGPIIEFPRRFLDESLGYTAGWMTWFSWIVLVAAELVAVTHIFQFRYPPNLLQAAGYPDPTLEFYPSASPAVYVFCFFLIMFAFNMLPVRWFGRLEYIFGTIKMLFIITLILFNVIVHIQQPVNRGAFWTYNKPYSFASQNMTLPNKEVVEGDVGRLLGVWEAMTTCLFGMIGFETIAITAAENRHLRTEETVKIGTRKISLRIITLYSLATFAVGLNVPYTYHTIVDDAVISFGFGQNSAFVVAPVINRLRVWPYIINDFIIFSAATAGANGLYNASRTLHALASIHDVWPSWGPVQALRRRLERTSYGVPHAAVVLSACFGLMGFLACNPDSQKILGRMVRCCVVSMMITYGLVAASFIAFYKSVNDAAAGQTMDVVDIYNPLVKQLYDRSHPRYPYRSHGQYLRAYYAVLACTLFVLFNGWRTFISPMNLEDFFGCYIAILLMAVISIMYQIKFWGWNPTKWRRRVSDNRLERPHPMTADSVPRRGQLTLVAAGEMADSPRRVENMKRFGRWILVWLK
ncbi:amino acid permease-domain-containing protein [Dactylonectria macrodidyma]|uniref:Amino acid permease-domain-containing protein n=1 Tax=Dactylonectria macrodidyma TaxID=307937 RepID=A0A9P9E3B2_9HYPO|nr:amino acid permease-domain-containing protein [Dactylonectria macrodidyma]